MAARAEIRLVARAIAVNDLDSAETHARRAAKLAPGWAVTHYRLGFVAERRRDFAEAISHYSRAIEIDGTEAEWHYRVAQCYRAVGDKQQVLAHAETTLLLDPGHERASHLVRKVMAKQMPAWRRLALLEMVVRANDASNVLLEHAEAAAALGHDEAALASWATAHGRGDGTKRSHFLAALAAERTGQADRARREFDTACALEGDLAQQIGPGIFHERDGDWAAALERYLVRWELGSRSAVLAFHLALAHDRLFSWKQAAEWFETALALDSREPYWHYKRAHALERSGSLNEAVDGYRLALEVGGGTQRDWWYRLGFCLSEVGRHHEALDALLHFAGERASAMPADDVGSRSAEDDADGAAAETSHQSSVSALRLRLAERGVSELPTDPDAWRRLALVQRDLGLLGAAHSSFVEYENRVPEIDVESRVSHAKVLAGRGMHEDAVNVMLDARAFARPDGPPLNQHLKSAHQRRRALYNEYRSRFPLDDSTVLFESYWGDKVACNPLAIYREAVRDPRMAGHTLVWTVKPGVTVPADVLLDGRTVLAPYGSELYVRTLATAGTVVNNTSFVDYFVRREGQRYLNTWHGTPLKTLGRRIDSDVLEYANVARNLRSTTHIVAPNEHTRDVLVQDYDLQATYAGEARVLGSPRLDAVVKRAGGNRASLFKRVGVANGATGRVVFYAPTWRGGTFDRSMGDSDVLEDIRAMASVPGVVLLYRLHHLVEKQFEGVDLPGIRVPDHVDTYEVLSTADVLVTDYSSLMFDFLATGRKVVLYTPDLAEYTAERGVYFAPDEVVDEVVTSRQALVDELARTEEFRPGEKYLSSQARFVRAEDGNAASSCIDIIAAPFAEPEPKAIADSRETLVFASSLIPNGISTALLNLLKNLDRSRYRLALCVDPSVLKKHPERLKVLAQVPEDVALVTRNGAMSTTVEERWIVDRHARGLRLSDVQLDVLFDAYRRELSRVLGTTRDVTLIEFEGYSLFWMTLFASADETFHRSVAFQHNEMVAEMNAKYPEFRRVFERYVQFDSIVAVSEATARTNESELSALGYLSGRTVSAVRNSLDAEGVRTRATAEVAPEVAAQVGGCPQILTIGRMSTEKNQIDMIRALKRVHETRPGTKLVVVGSGPLDAMLRAAAVTEGVAGDVVFTGQLDNPMPLLRQCDVFAMSSTHEGQPQVLFEAMLLGRPIVTYPTPGIVEAVEMGYGKVVAPNPEALAAALVSALDGDSVSRGIFDGTEFNDRVVAEFERVVSETKGRSLSPMA